MGAGRSDTGEEDRWKAMGTGGGVSVFALPVLKDISVMAMSLSLLLRDVRWRGSHLYDSAYALQELLCGIVSPTGKNTKVRKRVLQ